MLICGSSTVCTYLPWTKSFVKWNRIELGDKLSVNFSQTPPFYRKFNKYFSFIISVADGANWHFIPAIILPLVYRLDFTHQRINCKPLGRRRIIAIIRFKPEKLPFNPFIDFMAKQSTISVWNSSLIIGIDIVFLFVSGKWLKMWRKKIQFKLNGCQRDIIYSKYYDRGCK